MTKAQAKAAKAAWNLAGREGRIVRYGDPHAGGAHTAQFKAFATSELAKAAVADAGCDEVQIVDPALYAGGAE